MHDFSAAELAGLSKPGRYRLSASLYLKIGDSGRKSFQFRYSFDGVGRWRGLGSCELVPLAKARREALRLRVMVSEGIDPAVEQRRRKHRGVPAFAVLAAEYIELHRAGWRNGASAAQWESSLRLYAEPIIGMLPVSAVTTEHVLEILRPIWTKKPETASRLRGRIERILSFAKARSLREGENPAGREALQHLLPPMKRFKKVRHHPAMPHAAVPAFFCELRANGSTAARALEFCILTATRTSETLLAKQNEIDREAGVWTLPSGRMKNQKVFRVPLSPAVIKLTDGAAREGDGMAYLIPGTKEGRALGSTSMSELMGRLRLDFTVHGFRSSFRDWAGESGYPRELAELALAHTLKDATERAYASSDRIASGVFAIVPKNRTSADARPSTVATAIVFLWTSSPTKMMVVSVMIRSLCLGLGFVHPKQSPLRLLLRLSRHVGAGHFIPESPADMMV